MAVWCGLFLFVLAVVNLRWDFWQGNVSAFELPGGSAPFGLNLLILVSYGSICLFSGGAPRLVKATDIKRSRGMAIALYAVIMLAGFVWLVHARHALALLPTSIRPSIHESHPALLSTASGRALDFQGTVASDQSNAVAVPFSCVAGDLIVTSRADGKSGAITIEFRDSHGRLLGWQRGGAWTSDNWVLSTTNAGPCTLRVVPDHASGYWQVRIRQVPSFRDILPISVPLMIAAALVALLIWRLRSFQPTHLCSN
jgi:hypothetical protein